jgi:hypothetical protein
MEEEPYILSNLGNSSLLLPKVSDKAISLERPKSISQASAISKVNKLDLSSLNSTLVAKLKYERGSNLSQKSRASNFLESTRKTVEVGDLQTHKIKISEYLT